MAEQKRNEGDRDSKRVFRFAAVVAAVLIVLAIGFNAMWPRDRPGSIDTLASTVAPETPRNAPAPAEGRPAS